MLVVDIIIIGVVLYFLTKGFRSGFIKMLSFLAGVILGIWAAGQYYLQVANWLSSFIHTYLLAIVVSFVGLVVVVTVVVGLLLGLVNRIFNFLPVVGFFNKMLGGVIGLVEGIIIMGLIIWTINLLPFENIVTRALAQSQLRPYVEQSANWLQVLLPGSLKALNELKGQWQLPAVDINQLQQSVPWQEIQNKWPEQEWQKIQAQFEAKATTSSDVN